MKFKDIPQFPKAHYTIHSSWDYLEINLQRYAETWVDETTGHVHGGLELNPDYQRVHVWTEEQQIAYLEYMLRGGEVGRTIIWNCPTWMSGFAHPLELVDGKQRLEAVRKFLRNELPVFGTLKDDFEDNMNSMNEHFIFSICNVKTRAEILQMYININAGGTPHTKEEIGKVRKMLEEVKK